MRQRVAAILETSPEDLALMYQVWPAHPGSRPWGPAQMNHGFGGMLSFDVGEAEEDARRFIAALRTIYHAVSLGATESLICIPYLTTMLYLPPERRMAFGVRRNTVRLSMGIEPVDLLLADLKQALACLEGTVARRV